METERALQQLELLQKKLYAYHCADSSLYLDAVTTAPSGTAEGRGVTLSTAGRWKSFAAAVSS